MAAETLTQTLLVVSLFCLSLGLIAAATRWFFRRSEAILKRWAEQNDYELIEKKIRWFNQGPLFWSSSSGQTIYYVQVLQRQSGQVRRGWVRCGSYWSGLFSDKAEVYWDS